MMVSDPQLGFVNSYGYVSLFPFLLQILEPANPKLEIILTDLLNPGEGLIWLCTAILLVPNLLQRF